MSNKVRTHLITGSVAKFGKVGNVDFATVQPPVDDALPFIVTNLPDDIEVGDYVEVEATRLGERYMALKTTKGALGETESKPAESRIMDRASRKAFGETRRAEEATQASKADAAVSAEAASL